MCWATTMVTTPTVGAASAVRAAISPGWFVPISTTAASCSEPSRKSVSGSPHWLLKLAADFSSEPSACQHGRDQLLGRGLAVRAGDGHQRNGETRAVAGGQASQGHGRVVDQDEGIPGGGSSGSACTTRQEAPRAAASPRCRDRRAGGREWRRRPHRSGAFANRSTHQSRARRDHQPRAPRRSR